MSIIRLRATDDRSRCKSVFGGACSSVRVSVIWCAWLSEGFLVTRELEGSLNRVTCTTFQESAACRHAPERLCLLVPVVRPFSEPTCSGQRTVADRSLKSKTTDAETGPGRSDSPDRSRPLASRISRASPERIAGIGAALRSPLDHDLCTDGAGRCCGNGCGGARTPASGLCGTLL